MRPIGTPSLEYAKQVADEILDEFGDAFDVYLNVDDVLVWQTVCQEIMTMIIAKYGPRHDSA